MPENIRSFPKRLYLISLLCCLSACGGGATLNGSAEPQSAASTIAADTTIATDNTPTTGSTTVAPIVDDSESPASTENSADTENSQSSESAGGGVVQDPITEPVILTPEVELFPIDTGTGSTRITPAPSSISQDEPKEYSISDITDLILVTGQSNALGADTTYDPIQDSPHERVFAFTEDGWQRADLHQVWDLDWFPQGNSSGDPSNNFSLHAAKEIAYRRPDRVIGFVLASAPGKGIAHWDTNDAFFAEIDRKVLAAINQVPHKSGIDGILWHQGENDEGDNNYGEKLDQLIANFRQQSWFASDRPFICGETAVFEIVNQQLMAINDNGDPWSACVDGAGLQTREDGFHFNAEGLRELGRRYGVKYLSMD